MELLETMDAPTPLPVTTARQGLRLCGPEHPVSLELLDRFAAGAATRDERSTVVRHLLTGCSSCGRRLGRTWPLEAPQEPEDAYDRALDRSFERVLQAMRVRCSAA